MPGIHVIRINEPGLPQIETVDKAADLYQSGYWALSEERARGLVGGRIYFHREQAKPSFYGGVITAARKILEGEHAGRILFTFRYDPSCRNTRTSRAGWSQEMKLTE